MRTVVRAVIKNQDELLVIKRIKNKQTYWVFPGGGVEEGESYEQALIRECEEELGVQIKVGELLGEYFFDNPQFSKQQEFYYFCEIIGGKLGTGNGPEFQPNSHYEGLREIEWLKISELQKFDLRPVQIRDLLSTS